MQPHSPLPPEPEPSLALVSGKLDHAILVLEYVKGRTDTFDDSVEHLRTVSRDLHKTSVRLATATLGLMSVRNPISWRARIATMGIGAVVGGFLAQLAVVWVPKLFA